MVVHVFSIIHWIWLLNIEDLECVALDLHYRAKNIQNSQPKEAYRDVVRITLVQNTRHGGTESNQLPMVGKVDKVLLSDHHSTTARGQLM